MFHFRSTGRAAGAGVGDAHDDDETTPLCPAAERTPPARLASVDAPPREPTFSHPHEAAIQVLADVVHRLRAASPEQHRTDLAGRPVRLLEASTLAGLGDLFDARHGGPRLRDRIELDESSRRIGGRVVQLLASLVAEKLVPPRLCLSALKAPGWDGRAPFLSRLASQAVHDRALAASMCDLLSALQAALSAQGRPGELTHQLLIPAGDADMRHGHALPAGLPEGKYTSVLGRLIGDGQGEWGNDGAILAIGRLADEGLLPEAGAVVDERSKPSSARWRKQEKFVAMCRELRQLPAWQAPSPLPRSLAQVVSGLETSLAEWRDRSRRPADAASASPDEAQWDAALQACVDEALARGWKQLKQRFGQLMYERTSCQFVPGASVSRQLPLEREFERCGAGLLRLPKTPPERLASRVVAGVLRDLDSPPADPRAFDAALRRSVCRRVEEVLNAGDRLRPFLPAGQEDACRVRLDDGAGT